MSLIAQSAVAELRTVLITGGTRPRAAAAASAIRGARARPVVVDDLPVGVGVGGLSFEDYLPLPASVPSGDGDCASAHRTSPAPPADATPIAYADWRAEVLGLVGITAG